MNVMTNMFNELKGDLDSKVRRHKSLQKEMQTCKQNMDESLQQHEVEEKKRHTDDNEETDSDDDVADEDCTDNHNNTDDDDDDSDSAHSSHRVPNHRRAVSAAAPSPTLSSTVSAAPTKRDCRRKVSAVVTSPDVIDLSMDTDDDDNSSNNTKPNGISTMAKNYQRGQRRLKRRRLLNASQGAPKSSSLKKPPPPPPPTPPSASHARALTVRDVKLPRSKGRTRAWLNEHLERFTKYANITAKFGQCACATKTTKELGCQVQFLVLNDKWNILSTSTKMLQTLYVGTGEFRKKSGYALVGYEKEDNGNDNYYDSNVEDDDDSDTELKEAKMKCDIPNKETVAMAAGAKTTPKPVVSAIPLFHAPVIKERGTRNIYYVGHWLPLIDKFEIYDPPISITSLRSVNREERQMKIELQFQYYDAKFASLME